MLIRLATAFSLALLAATGPSVAQESLKLAFIDPLSGGSAANGDSALRVVQFMKERWNAKATGYQIEVTAYDNKLDPQESLVQLRKAIDAGTRIILQGQGSSVAAALIDFISKYNDRNPGKEVLFLNYAAIDPVLTNDKCSYWHFRFDASVDIKAEALTNYIKSQPEVKKVYLINQDYSFGQSVRTEARKRLADKRPDIQIVGDEVTPLQKVTDFSPYVAKIKASGADAIVTANWAQDINLLLRAAGDAGLKTAFYTYNVGSAGGPTAAKQANLDGRVFQITNAIANASETAREFEKAYRARSGQELTYGRAANMMNALMKAVQEGKSTDPKSIAARLEGMNIEVLDGGTGLMRADDHQFFEPMYISALVPQTPDLPFDAEGTGWAWKISGRIDPKDTIVPTTCKMKRPG